MRDTYVSTDDPTFRSLAESWLAQSGELSVHFRFSRAAGNCEFELFRDLDSFRGRLAELPPQTFVSVFREPQLPLRGRVDQAFIDSALASIPDGHDYLVAGLEQVSAGSHSWYRYDAGWSHAELRDDLEHCIGDEVAVGPFPGWADDPERVVSAIVPESDGSVVHGVY